MNYLLHSCCVQFSANQFALHTFLLDHQLWANQSWGFVYCRRQGKVFVHFGIIEVKENTKLMYLKQTFSLWCILSIFTYMIVFFKFGWILDYLWGKSFVLQCSFPSAKWNLTFEPGLSLPVDKLVKMYQETAWPSEHFVFSTEQIFLLNIHVHHTCWFIIIYEVHGLTVHENFQHWTSLYSWDFHKYFFASISSYVGSCLWT